MSYRLCSVGIALSVCVAALLNADGRAPEPQAATPTATLDVEKLGPQVGDVMPDFTLPDQHGTKRSLKSILGSNGAVIVFFRSADW